VLDLQEPNAKICTAGKGFFSFLVGRGCNRGGVFLRAIKSSALKNETRDNQDHGIGHYTQTFNR